MKFRIDLKILFFLILFLITGQIEIYIIAMIFALLHELVHVLVGIILKFKLQEIELMPLGFWASLQPNYKDYKRKIKKSNIVEVKKIGIAIAGPLLNLVFSFILKDILAYSNLIIFILNMIPIYPLDGGRIVQSLSRIYLGKQKADKFVNVLANIVVILLTIVGSIAILYLKNIAIVLILAYIWELVIRENKRFEIKQKISKIL